jgi:hypothetical protein
LVRLPSLGSSQADSFLARTLCLPEPGIRRHP